MMTDDEVAKLSKALIKEGKVIEVGWVSTMLVSAPEDTPAHIIASMRASFFSGAKYMLDAMVIAQDPRVSDGTVDKLVADLKKELQEFEGAMALMAAQIRNETPH